MRVSLIQRLICVAVFVSSASFASGQVSEEYCTIEAAKTHGIITVKLDGKYSFRELYEAGLIQVQRMGAEGFAQANGLDLDFDQRAKLFGCFLVNGTIDEEN